LRIQCFDHLILNVCFFGNVQIRQDPRFVPYFRTATPELELSKLNVGSRPGKRNPKGGVESLRAIPWVFGWTQTRLNLPSWLGITNAFTPSSKDGAVATVTEDEVRTLKSMYKDWSWFSSFVDLLEMILAKSEPNIAQAYDQRLLNDSQSVALGGTIPLSVFS
jgi:phosphoenolpyruvate carboxylase